MKTKGKRQFFYMVLFFFLAGILFNACAPKVSSCERLAEQWEKDLRAASECQSAEQCVGYEIGRPFSGVYGINKEKAQGLIPSLRDAFAACETSIKPLERSLICRERQCRLAEDDGASGGEPGKKDGTQPGGKPREPSSGTGTPACKFPKFTIHPQGNPLQTSDGEQFRVADPSVMYDEGKFKMWFTTGTETVTGTGYAESADGLVWTQRQTANPGNVILQPVKGTWQHNGRETVSVLKKDAAFHMWYTGYPNCWFVGSSQPSGCGRIVAIGYATSKDGVAWKDYANNPVIVPEKKNAWEGPFEKTANEGGEVTKFWLSGADEPAVLWNEQLQMYQVWFTSAQTINNRWQSNIGYATSLDGITWKKYAGNPVFSPIREGEGYDTQVVGHSNVVKDPQYGYHLFYTGGASTANLRIGHAWSPDGISWERDPQNPILDLGTGTLPNGEKVQLLTGGPSAIFKEGKLYLYFMATKTITFSMSTLYLATAECSS